MGPELTFALREGIFALATAEETLATLYGCATSNIQEMLGQAMSNAPANWNKHYNGSPLQQQFLRKFSYSDRIRYYWTDNSVRQALNQLLENLEKYPIPMVLLSQLLPIQYERVREGLLDNHPRDILKDCVCRKLDKYGNASGDNL